MVRVDPERRFFPPPSKTGLDAAERVKILPQERTPSLSQIFKWYQYDFEGGASAVIDMLLNYLDEGQNKDF